MEIFMFIFTAVVAGLCILQEIRIRRVKKQPTLEDLMNGLKVENFEHGTYDVKEFRERMETVKQELNDMDAHEMYDGVPLYNVPVFTTEDEEIVGVEVITPEIEQSMERTALQRYK